jgi:DnaJ like chaperone protein
MNTVTIILIIVVAVIVYALITMSRKPAGSTGPRQGGGNIPPSPPPGNTPRRKYGKWVGGGLGFVFGGPIGAILGVALGSMFDGIDGQGYAYRGTPRGDFAMSLLVLSAAVMKADRKVVRAELDYVRDFFTRQFGPDEGSRLILMLREILKQDIDVAGVSAQIGRYLEYPVKLQLLHYLFGIASADGAYQAEELNVLEEIAKYLGVTASDFQSVKAMFAKDPGWAYQVLEVPETATNDEVKSAYREMAKKHHPDKVSHLGEDIRQAATEKFQKISAAYDEIKKSRGIV